MPSPLRKESLSNFVSRMMGSGKGAPAPKQRGYSEFKRQKKKA